MCRYITCLAISIGSQGLRVSLLMHLPIQISNISKPKPQGMYRGTIIQQWGSICEAIKYLACPLACTFLCFVVSQNQREAPPLPHIMSPAHPTRPSLPPQPFATCTRHQPFLPSNHPPTSSSSLFQFVKEHHRSPTVLLGNNSAHN